jgi:hypothetical protein
MIIPAYHTEIFHLEWGMAELIVLKSATKKTDPFCLKHLSAILLNVSNTI